MAYNGHKNATQVQLSYHISQVNVSENVHATV